MPTQFSTRIIIVVTAAVAAAANDRAATVDGGRAEARRTFVAGLSPTGNLPATHYWCSWQMRSADRLQFRTLIESLPNPGVNIRVAVLDSDDSAVARPRPEAILSAAGLQRIRMAPL